MWVRMTESVMTGFGVYNVGQSYDLPDALAQECLRLGRAECVEHDAPECAMEPRPTRPHEQHRQGRGRPSTAR